MVCSRNAKAHATETGRQTSSRTAAAVTVSRQSSYGYESQLSGMLRELRVHCTAADNQQGTWIYNNVPTKCQDHRTPGNCDQFTATGSCDYGDQCKFQHIGADGRLMNEQGNAQSGRTAFRDLAPGSLKRYCKYNEDENCHLGDNCPFTHKGREIAQEELAIKKEQALKSAASSSSGPPQYGRSGLSRAAE